MSAPAYSEAAPVEAEAAWTRCTEKSGDEADAQNSAASITLEQVMDCFLVVALVGAQLKQIVHRVPLDEYDLGWVEMAINWTAPEMPYRTRMMALALFREAARDGR